MRIVVGHLYPDYLNIYADRGNIAVLSRRAAWRGHELEVKSVSVGDALEPGEHDLLYIGGGQDREQALVAEDLAVKGEDIREAVAAGAALLAVCGGYQLLGEYYVTAEGKQLPGLGLVDLHTVPGSRRNIGNIVIETSGLGLEPATLVGFENHSGKTYLGTGLQPLGRVLRGAGNNGEDGNEGVVRGNVFGTYLHGSLLPKNPHFADLLIQRALQRKGIQGLAGLASTEELAAHQSVSERVLDRSASTRS